MSKSCILCSTRDGRVPVATLYEDDLVFAIDMPSDSPHYLGPVHFLVISNEHIPSALYLTDDDAAVVGRLFAVAAKVAREKGIADTGFRLVTNVGPDAHQTVFHLHLHCIGGRKLGDEC
ncbi:MAG: HIT domain-containing protein [Mycobacterium sp.]